MLLDFPDARTINQNKLLFFNQISALGWFIIETENRLRRREKRSEHYVSTDKTITIPSPKCHIETHYFIVTEVMRGSHSKHLHFTGKETETQERQMNHYRKKV